jgi:hypothetical protein
MRRERINHIHPLNLWAVSCNFLKYYSSALAKTEPSKMLLKNNASGWKRKMVSSEKEKEKEKKEGNLKKHDQKPRRYYEKRRAAPSRETASARGCWRNRREGVRIALVSRNAAQVKKVVACGRHVMMVSSPVDVNAPACGLCLWASENFFSGELRCRCPCCR